MMNVKLLKMDFLITKAIIVNYKVNLKMLSNMLKIQLQIYLRQLRISLTLLVDL